MPEPPCGDEADGEEAAAPGCTGSGEGTARFVPENDSCIGIPIPEPPGGDEADACGGTAGFVPENDSCIGNPTPEPPGGDEADGGEEGAAPVQPGSGGSARRRVAL